MNLSELTRQLTQTYTRGSKFLFVTQAHQVLARVGDAPELATATLRALVELGLGGPARELIQHRRDLADTDELTTAIAALPNGRVAWDSCGHTFQHNIDALLRDRPHLAPLVDTCRTAVRDVQLFRTAAGQYQLSKTRRPRELREWLPALTDEGDDENVQLPPRGQFGVPVLINVRIGPLLQRAYHDTHRLFLSYSHPLYLVEPDPARFAAWLHVADVADILADERVYPFVGPSCVQDFAALLREQSSLPLPTIHISHGIDASLAKHVQETTEAIQAERDAILTGLKDELAERHRNRDAAYWAQRMANPTCALGVTSRYTTMLQYSTRDTLHALKELGYETDVMIEPKDHYHMSHIDVCRRLLELDPDMVIFLDHLRYEYDYLPDNLPFLAWIQDPMDNLLCRRAGSSIGPLDFVCGYYRNRCINEFGYPADRFIEVDIPVSTRLFHDAALDEDAMNEYGCDISFVSNASTPVEQFYKSVLATYTPAVHPLLAVLYERAHTLPDRREHIQPGLAAYDLVRSVADEMALPLNDADIQHIAVNFVYRVFDWGRRQQSLEWVADWARRTGRAFKIYGRGWEDHPTLSEFACGVIAHGEPLRRAYRASKLALQLIPSGFRHQRSYELLAAGTVPLTRYCRADFEGDRCTATIFPGLERIVFRSREEFEQLAETMLADESYRRDVLADLRAVVLERFTYTTTMRDVLKQWQAALKGQLTGAAV